MSVQISKEKRHPQNHTQPTLQGHEDTPAPALPRVVPHSTHRECRCRRAASRSFGRCAGARYKSHPTPGRQGRDFPDSEKGSHIFPAPAYPGADIFCKPVVLYFSFRSFLTPIEQGGIIIPYPRSAGCYMPAAHISPVVHVPSAPRVSAVAHVSAMSYVSARTHISSVPHASCSDFRCKSWAQAATAAKSAFLSYRKMYYGAGRNRELQPCVRAFYIIKRGDFYCVRHFECILVRHGAGQNFPGNLT